MKIDISVEELVVLLTELGVNLKDEKVKEAFIRVITNKDFQNYQNNQPRIEFIKEVLVDCKFQVGLSGFACLARAIELKMGNPDISLMTGIYERIGKENFEKGYIKSNSALNVERNIRHILANHFEEYIRNPECYPSVCQNFYNSPVRRTNGEVIAYYANYISSLQKKKENQKILKK